MRKANVEHYHNKKSMKCYPSTKTYLHYTYLSFTLSIMHALYLFQLVGFAFIAYITLHIIDREYNKFYFLKATDNDTFRIARQHRRLAYIIQVNRQ